MSAELLVEADRPVDRLELYLELPREIELVEGTAARAIRLSGGEERVLPVVLRCATWGSFQLGTARARARDPFRLVTWEARLGSRQRLKAFPPRDHAAPHPRPGRDAALRGQRGLAGEGGRDRVRGPPRLRPRRPRPHDQLACVRASAEPRGERATRRAEHRRRALRGQLRRRPRGGAKRARGRRAGSRRAGDALPRSPQSRRARRVRRHPALAAAGAGGDPALPPDRDAARDGRRAHIHLAPRQRDPSADPPAQLARARPDPARRPEVRHRPRGPPRDGGSTSLPSRSIPSRSSSPDARRSSVARTACGCSSARSCARVCRHTGSGSRRGTRASSRTRSRR